MSHCSKSPSCGIDNCERNSSTNVRIMLIKKTLFWSRFSHNQNEFPSISKPQLHIFFMIPPRHSSYSNRFSWGFRAQPWLYFHKFQKNTLCMCQIFLYSSGDLFNFERISSIDVDNLLIKNVVLEWVFSYLEWFSNNSQSQLHIFFMIPLRRSRHFQVPFPIVSSANTNLFSWFSKESYR